MKADLTRNTFDPFKHYSRVIMQQGRVQLDADWNEQAAILVRSLRALAADLIGPQGGPASNLGFAVTPYPPAAVSPAPVPRDFQIGLGAYYVDGIRCEADSAPVAITVPSAPPAGNTATVQVDHWTLDGAPFQVNQFLEVIDDVRVPNLSPAFSPTVVEITAAQQTQLTLTLQGVPATLNNATAPKLRRVITYMTQPDYPVPDSEELAASTAYLIYLDVWERHITYVEDDSIREVALGGPDTATRAKVVWQVKAVAGNPETGGESPCDNFTPRDPNFLVSLFGTNRGQLRAKAAEKGASKDPCVVPPDARFRGPENQLYRVEIHRPGSAWDGNQNTKSAAATFKWSRENGSVVFPIVTLATGSGTTTVTLESLGRDDRFGLAEGNWVEIQDDPFVLQNRAENLLQVQSIDRTSLTVTLNGVPGSSVGQDPTKHPLLRRWDHRAGDPAEGGLTLGTDNGALLQEDLWLELENGVQVQFQMPDAGQPPNAYRTSDYWLIPARTATGDVEWPTEQGKDSSGNLVTAPIAQPPAGVQHHYAPLDVITVGGNGNITTSSTTCRKKFTTLVDLTPQ